MLSKAFPRRMTVFVLVMLLVEFLDEFTFGVTETAWPFIRNELDLNYAQIGLLIGIPLFLANFIEPIFGLLADTPRRRLVMVGGGIMYGVALLWVASSQSYAMMMLALILLMPASGAFIGTAQASLMDHEPDRHDQNMARWTFAGSVGMVIGPLALGAFLLIGSGWRPLLVLIGGLMMLAAFIVWRLPANAALRSHASDADDAGEPEYGLMDNARLALGALKRPAIWRWLILLQFSDLMLDVLFSYLALYFVDVVGVGEAQAGLAVAVWSSVGLLGDFLLIPLLERIQGLAYLRISVVAELILYPAFLLVDDITLKLVILGIIGLFNAGWYAILSGKLYSALPGQSGIALTLGNVGGLFGSLIPALVGIVASHYGLQAAMWVMLAGPVVLFIGLPWRTDKPIKLEESAAK
ncbi:MFS transporter [Phototrophicus methaneseepsis]|uniref:MFS transporter n=1 Tax=Phototrophicus methaneseepsis TaxID=2710758 RepID=A0A7S8E984_9CHLR|nr:MFS transporter [Phototrophicus methaneseepsis]QPC82682.1 MFS transporter [Phototrophicus methaneseepsis]